MAIILPASRTDQSWNQQGATSLESLKEKWSLITEVAENSGYGDIKPLVRDLANKGFDLVMGHANGYNTAGPEVAVEKDIRVTTIDSKTAVKGLALLQTLTTGAKGELIWQESPPAK